MQPRDPIKFSLVMSVTHSVTEGSPSGREFQDSERANVENELAAVKKRLEVVEAIVTDKRYQLDAEIAELSKSERIQ